MADCKDCGSAGSMRFKVRFTRIGEVGIVMIGYSQCLRCKAVDAYAHHDSNMARVTKLRRMEHS